jgi:hypothetical protein
MAVLQLIASSCKSFEHFRCFFVPLTNKSYSNPSQSLMKTLLLIAFCFLFFSFKPKEKLLIYHTVYIYFLSFSCCSSLIFFFHFSFIIHMCIQGLVHFSPLPPPPPLPPAPPPPSPPPIPSRNYFALISNFVVERV